MENIEIINFLKEATYLDTIIVTKSNNTTTIIDTVNNVEFKSTYMPEYLKKFHCYFTNSEDICWLTNSLNRVVIGNREFDKNTLPLDWQEEDLLILTNNEAYFSSQELVLSLAFNYFSNHLNELKTFKSGAYSNLDKN